jgi:hypothetical protein
MEESNPSGVVLPKQVGVLVAFGDEVEGLQSVIFHLFTLSLMLRLTNSVSKAILSLIKYL